MKMYTKPLNVIFIKLIFPIVFCCGIVIFSSLADQSTLLSTQTENSYALSLTNYKYDEPGYMTLKAQKIGLAYSGTHAFGAAWPNPNQTWFLKTDLSYSSGGADYQSPISGNISNTPSWYLEARALFGKDIQMGSYVLAPYVGVGYRHLYSDIGYQRDSFYTTLPIGITHKVKLDNQAQLLTTFEYMHLLKGQQKVKLATQNVSLDQKSGFGIRASMLRRQNKWSFGPTLTFWNFDPSEVGGTTPVFEPKNKTLEIGLKGAMHF
jgi:hypothetical protein